MSWLQYTHHGSTAILTALNMVRLPPFALVLSRMFFGPSRKRTVHAVPLLSPHAMVDRRQPYWQLPGPESVCICVVVVLVTGGP